MLSILFLLLSSVSLFADGPGGVQLFATLDGPQPLATVVNISASIPGAARDAYWFRFRIKGLDGSYSMIRDFGPIASLDWTVYDREGVVEMEVSARENATGAITVESMPYEWTAIASNAVVVTPTQHPLVYLYSAPPCRKGLTSHVQFSVTGGQSQTTPAKACDGAHTMNFLIAGVPQNTEITLEDSITNTTTVVNGNPRGTRSDIDHGI